MSVRGEYRRLLGDLVGTLREAGAAADTGVTEALDDLGERASDDLSGAAEQTLAVLSRLGAVEWADASLRERFDGAFERLEAICRIILGR
ncbi:MAG: hypothetical protein AAF430_20250 [Myxococcota bacterium]